jgi:starch synthase
MPAFKKDLQERLKLPVDAKIPLIGMVSRLDTQKGFNHVVEIIPKLAKSGVPVQWAILGLGDPKIQEELKKIAAQYPKIVALHFLFDDPMAHRIYAGADLFFMPSLFEPCGLSQMIAMRYGSIPVVTPTGGLLDTVAPWDAKTRKGSGFRAEKISTEALLEALNRAAQTLAVSDQRKNLMENAMAQNFSWAVSAADYAQLYSQALNARKN